MSSMYIGGGSVSQYSRGPKSFYFRMPERAIEYEDLDAVISRCAAKINRGEYETAVELFAAEVEPLMAQIRAMAEPNDPHLKAANHEYNSLHRRLRSVGPPVPIGQGGLRHMGVVLNALQDPESASRPGAGGEWGLNGQLKADAPPPPRFRANGNSPIKPSRRLSREPHGGNSSPMTLGGQIVGADGNGRSPQQDQSPSHYPHLPWPKDQVEEPMARALPESRLQFEAPERRRVSLADRARRQQQQQQQQPMDGGHHQSYGNNGPRYSQSPLGDSGGSQHNYLPLDRLVDSGGSSSGSNGRVGSNQQYGHQYGRGPSAQMNGHGGGDQQQKYYPNMYQNAKPAGIRRTPEPSTGYTPSPLSNYNAAPGAGNANHGPGNGHAAAAAAPRWSRASSRTPGGNTIPYEPSRQQLARRRQALQSQFERDSESLKGASPELGGAGAGLVSRSPEPKRSSPGPGVPQQRYQPSMPPPRPAPVEPPVAAAMSNLGDPQVNTPNASAPTASESLPPWLNEKPATNNSPNAVPVFPSTTTHDISQSEPMEKPRQGRRRVSGSLGSQSSQSTGLGFSAQPSLVRGRRMFHEQQKSNIFG